MQNDSSCVFESAGGTKKINNGLGNDHITKDIPIYELH